MSDPILILRGVTYESLFQCDPYEAYTDDTSDAIGPVYDKLPDVFAAHLPWPRTSNLHCVNCDCVTDRIPCFVPQSSSMVAHEGAMVPVFKVGPSACSIFCEASAGLAAAATQSQRDAVVTLIRAKARVMTGRAPTHIRPAPPKKLLARYGGTLDDFDYQKLVMALWGDGEAVWSAETNELLTFCD